MLIQIRSEKNRNHRITDKKIAEELGITPASFSRLITGVTEPKIMTWYKIYQEYVKYMGIQRANELMSKIEYDN